MEELSNEQVQAAGLDDWRKLAQRLHARFRVPEDSAVAEAVAMILQAAGPAHDHLELRLLDRVIDIAVCSRAGGRWITAPDLDLARAMSEVARDLGLRPEPGAVTQLELALDTAHQDTVGPFWSALLTGSPDNKIYDTIFDPTDRVPSLWFQATDDHEVPRQRWHFDLWLAPESAEGRIAVAVAAGGTIVDDSAAPSFTVLADPEGNRVCICTSLDRN